MKLKALIFDVDGTLADTEEVHRKAFNEAFRVHALEWHWSATLYAHLLSVGGGKQRLEAYIDSLLLAESDRAQLRARIPEIHRSKTDIYTAAVSAGAVELRDGVARLLEECLRAGVKLAIASTTTAANIDMLLSRNLGTDAIKWFSVIGAGDIVARKKPAPDIYQWTLRELQESPADCVAVEDSAIGLSAAKAAGLFTVVTPNRWTVHEDFATANLLLPYLGSALNPLTEIVAAHIGSTMLGVHELDQLLLRRPATLVRRFHQRGLPPCPPDTPS
jgi:beta-phosphoglucomutase-like phosphatase (HAD superfamily)